MQRKGLGEGMRSNPHKIAVEVAEKLVDLILYGDVEEVGVPNWDNSWDEEQKLRAKIAATLSKDTTSLITEAYEPLVEKAATLSVRMKEIEDSPSYQGIWTIAAVHGIHYKGPNWKGELDELRSELARVKGDA